jgi:Ca2+:H+ antiporter
MKGLVRHLRHRPLDALVLVVPVVLAVEHASPDSHTLLFFLAVAAIVPLAAILSHATESVAARTGDAVGGLLSATCGNLTELVIAITALKAGMTDLVRASIAGAIVTNSLFMLGGCFLIGGLRHRVQQFNPVGARVQESMLLLGAIALLIPSALVHVERLNAQAILGPLSVGLSCVLLLTYGLGLVFSLKTHRKELASVGEGEEHGRPWPLGVAVVVLAVATVLVALVGEVFVGSVQQASASLGMSKAFVGFVVVSMVTAAAEITTAFAAARKDRLDLSVGVALGSAAQIALFVAPMLVFLSYLVAPAPMLLVFGGGQVLLVLLTTLTLTTVVSSGRSAWYLGAQLLAVYAVFAVTLFLLPD